MNSRIWIFAGLLILIGWCFPASTMVAFFPSQDREPFGSPLAFTLLVIFSLSLIVAALLINSGLHLLIQWQNGGTAYYGNKKKEDKHTGKTAAAILFLSAVLLAAGLYKFYWFMIWDSTYDGLGYLWLPIPILAVLSSTIMLTIALPEGTKVAALFYLLLIPTLIIISAQTQQLDFRHLTEERAERISQALDSYYAQKGRYPKDLQQLTPRYLISIPGPVIIYGQDWCYNGGSNYYRLGYVDREHWSSPTLFGHIFRSWEKIPDLPAICEQEAAGLIERDPNKYWTFEE